MPPTYQLLMPGVLAGSAGLIGSRNPRRYPALLSWAMLTAVFVGMVWGSGTYPPWIIAAGAALLPFQVRECLICARFRVTRPMFAAASMAAAGLSVGIAWVTAPEHIWTVGRSYHQLFWMLVMIAATASRPWKSVLLHQRDVAYLVGMTLWLCIKAPASSFVRDGLGARLFPHVVRDSVEVWCWWSVMACIVGMALAMWAKSAGRKRAAKNTKGQTVTGLIEMEKAA